MSNPAKEAMRGFWQDLLFSFRLFRKSPALTALAIGCLGLGVGMNTPIFSLVNYLYLRPLPVSHAGQVVIISGAATLCCLGRIFAISATARGRWPPSLLPIRPNQASIDYDGNSNAIGTEPVTADYPRAVGAPLAIGRWFRKDDEASAVISYRIWRSMFAGDPDVPGKQVRSEGRWYKVVGVAGKEFAGTYLPIGIDLWIPFGTWAAQYPNNRTSRTAPGAPWCSRG